MAQDKSCTFCQIVSGDSPANIRFQDEELMVIDNVLGWVPVMLLVLPKRHMTQGEMWSHDLMGKICRVAVQMGGKFCPNGYRLLSNFGHDGMQSQQHGHLHVLGGMYLGPYA